MELGRGASINVEGHGCIMQVRDHHSSLCCLYVAMVWYSQVLHVQLSHTEGIRVSRRAQCNMHVSSIRRPIPRKLGASRWEVLNIQALRRSTNEILLRDADVVIFVQFGSQYSSHAAHILTYPSSSSPTTSCVPTENNQYQSACERRVNIPKPNGPS